MIAIELKNVDELGFESTQWISAEMTANSGMCFHRMRGPAVLLTFEGRRLKERHYRFCRLHREKGPAFIDWYNNGQRRRERHYVEGTMHCREGPSWLSWNEDGTVRERLFAQR